MRLNQIINLSVYTQSGQFLGNVNDLEIDADTGKIIKFYINNKKFLPKILGQEKNFIIHFFQVISLTPEKMIVEDGAIKIKSGQPLEEGVITAA